MYKKILSEHEYQSVMVVQVGTTAACQIGGVNRCSMWWSKVSSIMAYRLLTALQRDSMEAAGMNLMFLPTRPLQFATQTLLIKVVALLYKMFTLGGRRQSCTNTCLYSIHLDTLIQSIYLIPQIAAFFQGTWIHPSAMASSKNAGQKQVP